MSHDFVVRSWSVNTRLLKGKGQDSIEFTVPGTRGSHAYSCTPHAGMMGGTIVVN
jgi:plastocyanin